VSPLGTLLRSFLGTGGFGLVVRLFVLVQACGLWALRFALDHGLVLVAVAVIPVDAALTALLLRRRSHVQAWRDRIWHYSERVRWL
jgi:hypothetical protein